MTEKVASAVIPGFADLTEQEIFDTAARHVLKNGRPSLNDTTNECCYSGIGCAAAPFLLPERRGELDRFGATWQGLAELGAVPLKHQPLVSAIQLCHDRPGFNMIEAAHFIQEFKHEMLILAMNYQLDPAVLDSP